LARALAAMDYMRQGIFLRSYAQKNRSRNTSERRSSVLRMLRSQSKFDTINHTSRRSSVRRREEIEREEYERQQRHWRGHCSAARRGYSPIQATAARGRRRPRLRDPRLRPALVPRTEEPLEARRIREGPRGRCARFVRDMPKVGPRKRGVSVMRKGKKVQAATVP